MRCRVQTVRRVLMPVRENVSSMTCRVTPVLCVLPTMRCQLSAETRDLATTLRRLSAVQRPLTPVWRDVRAVRRCLTPIQRLVRSERRLSMAVRRELQPVMWRLATKQRPFTSRFDDLASMHWRVRGVFRHLATRCDDLLAKRCHVPCDWHDVAAMCCLLTVVRRHVAAVNRRARAVQRAVGRGHRDRRRRDHDAKSPTVLASSSRLRISGRPTRPTIRPVLGFRRGCDLHPDRIDHRTMGTVFEELIRKVNEALNENPGEHVTCRDVVHLMADLMLAGDADRIRRRAIVSYAEVGRRRANRTGPFPALRDGEPTEHSSLALVAARVPRSVVCLVTALRVHGIRDAGTVGGLARDPAEGTRSARQHAGRG